MWFGKFALISYIFSAVLLAVALLIFNTLGVELYAEGSITEESLETLIGRHNVTATPNTNFIFGDFLAGLQAIGAILFQSISGGVIGDALGAIPFFTMDVAITIIFRAIFTFCTACLIINLLTGREL